MFWYYLEPEGISGFFYFTSYLRTLLVFIISAVLVIVLFIAFFPRKFTLKAFGIFFLYVVIVGVVSPYVNYYLTGLAFQNAMYGSIQKKYRLLNETEDLVIEGKYDEAHSNAIEVFHKAQEKRSSSSVFILTNLYLHSESHQMQQLLKEYAAKLNLGFTLLELDQYDSAQHYLNDVLSISKTHFSPDDNIDLIPRSLLAETFSRRGDIDSAFFILKSLNSNLEFDEKFDLNRFLINSSIKAQYYDLIGNERAADNLVFDIRRAYENKYDQPGSVTYFGILTSNLWVEVKVKNWEKAQLTYEKIEELLKTKHRNSAIYFNYLMAKINFLDLSKKNKASFKDQCIGTVSSVIQRVRGLTTEDYLNNKILEILEEAESIAKEKFGKTSSQWFVVMEYQIAQLIQNKEYERAKKELSELDDLYKSADNKLLKMKIDELHFILGYFLNQDTLVYKSFKNVNAYFTKYINKGITHLTNDEKVELVTYNDKWQKISEFILSQINTEESIQLLANSVLLNKGLSLRASFSNDYSSNNFDFNTVQNALKNDQVAIQILRIEHALLARDRIYYKALVYTNKWEQPKLITLGNESELKNLMSEEITSKSFDGLYNTELRQCLDSLRPFISGKYKRVYLNTAGIYNSISFAALNPDTGVEFINVIDFNDIKEQDSVSFQNPKILAYGGLEYSNVINDRKTSQERLSNHYLEYTLSEVESIKNTFIGDCLVKVFTKNKGTEKSFREEIGNKFEIIHLATHGYYDNLNHQSSYRKQMHNCGVLFAPGWDNTQEDDGNITAYDISKMNLSKTKLVVLSACNTGLGNESAYDGIFGFQRAFKMAGVTYVISSLWSIPDEETAMFMKYFYEHLGDNNEVLDAFYLSQQKMKNEGYSPFGWGGFVISR